MNIIKTVRRLVSMRRGAPQISARRREFAHPFADLHEAKNLAETFFMSQGNPEEMALGPKDHATLLGFAVIAGRKMEGMPAGAINEDMGKEISEYAWKITTACFQACEPPGPGNILYKRPDLAQTMDEDLLVPLLSMCVKEGREMERRRIALAATS